jgi:site-specific recombinase XerD
MSRRADKTQRAYAAKDLPEIIRAAGDGAVRAYLEVLNDPRLHVSTRNVYRLSLERFFHWASSHGLTLETIDMHSLAVFEAEIASRNSQHEAAIQLKPVRRVLRHLARTGILASDPCPQRKPSGWPNSRGK